MKDSINPIRGLSDSGGFRQLRDGRADLPAQGGLPAEKADRSTVVCPAKQIYDEQSILRRLIATISRWRRRRAAIQQLQALNDHYLTDIGLERSDIASAVREATAKEPGAWHRRA